MANSLVYYKNLKIIRSNYNQLFTIVNESKFANNRIPHSHANSLKAAKEMVDCYYDLVEYGLTEHKSPFIRTGAMRLLGFHYSSVKQPIFNKKYSRRHRNG